jgi:nitroimidazol reductase NimA-like FMN-containing flavoprotein (pyridoxamine 5'-phosphate oxidase superfamily)
LKEKREMKKILHELFDTQRLAVLGTHREGQPYGNLVAFAATDDLKNLLLATTRATRKFANMTADARVSMLIDNRSNKVADFRNAVAVSATGKAREVRGREREKFLKPYLAKHPHLRDFVSSPTCALLTVRVDKYYLVYRFQNVLELKI